MQTDFTTLVDTLYGTTTVSSEIPNTVQILTSNTSVKLPEKQSSKWVLYGVIGIASLVVLYFLFSKLNSMPSVVHNTQQQQVVTQHMPIVPEMQMLPHQEILRAIESVPVLAKPDIFPIHGEIPISEDFGDNETTVKISSEGNDMQEYIKRREESTKRIESNV